MSGFSDAELERYARHLVLREIGGRGQAALKAARIAVVGAGGLGSPCLLYLAAAGMGRITVIDDDIVSLSNLQRQTLFGVADIGQPKAEVAVRHLHALNPHVEVVPALLRLDAGNADALLAGHDLVIDGCDSIATRLVVADTALALRTPLVSGAVGPFDGQVATFKGHDPALPCYRCLVGDAADQPGRSCADTGVVGALTGIIGSLMALEAIKEITGAGTSLAGRLLLYDGLSARSRTIVLPKDPACPSCGTAAAV